jgi:hypothetical protein
MSYVVLHPVLAAVQANLQGRYARHSWQGQDDDFSGPTKFRRLLFKMVRRQGESSWSCCSSEASSGGRDAAWLVSFGQVPCCSCVVVVAVFGLAGVE